MLPDLALDKSLDAPKQPPCSAIASQWRVCYLVLHRCWRAIIKVLLVLLYIIFQGHALFPWVRQLKAWEMVLESQAQEALYHNLPGEITKHIGPAPLQSDSKICKASNSCFTDCASLSLYGQKGQTTEFTVSLQERDLLGTLWHTPIRECAALLKDNHYHPCQRRCIVDHCHILGQSLSIQFVMALKTLSAIPYTNVRNFTSTAPSITHIHPQGL